MTRRIINIVLTMVLCVLTVVNAPVEVKAMGVCEDVEMSELMTDDAIIGYSSSNTWGVYYSDGYSIINKISSTKVGAGGATNAHVKCTVSVTSILERKNASGTWVRVNSWTQENTNAYSAVVSKSVTVVSGYYYRVRGYHYAGSDSSTSFTDALWVN